VLELLLSHEDVDVHAIDHDGVTPLELLLHREDVGVQATDHDGVTPIELVAGWELETSFFREGV